MFINTESFSFESFENLRKQKREQKAISQTTKNSPKKDMVVDLSAMAKPIQEKQETTLAPVKHTR
jgi:hypothetical protein